MKKELIILIIFNCQIIFGQLNIEVGNFGCPINTISTNPITYNNSLDPGNALQWDWKEQNFTVYLTTQFGTPGTPFTIVNPFYDQSQNPNTYSLASELIKDFKPENGWELLYKAFGSLEQGVVTPYFILYNRYNGTVRVFANIINSGDFTYNAAAITLDFHGNEPSSKRQTAVLNQLGKYTFSMNEMQRDALHFAPNKYLNSGVNNNYFWLYADFNTLFDPCTCGVQSNWFLKIGLINSIDITASINGTQRTILDANPNGTNSEETTVGSFFGSVKKYTTFGSGVINGVSGAFKSAEEAKKSGESLITNAESFATTNADLIGKNNSTSLARVLGKLFYEAPKVNMIMTLASTLITVITKIGNDYNNLNPEPKSLESMGSTKITEAKIDLTVTGTLKVTSPYVDAAILVPGSMSNTTVESSTPIYNNILGIFNLFEQPQFKITTYKPVDDLMVPHIRSTLGTAILGSNWNASDKVFPPISKLELINTPKIILNPASNLKIVSTEYQIVYENNFKDINYEFTGPMIPGPLNHFKTVHVKKTTDAVPGYDTRTIFSTPNTSANEDDFLFNNGYNLNLRQKNHLNDMDSAIFSTPHLPQNCINKLVLFNYSNYSNPILKVKVILEPINQNPQSEVDEIIYVLSFPGVIIEENGPNYTISGTPELLWGDPNYIPLAINLPINLSGLIFKKMSDLTIDNQTINQNIYCIGDITIGNNVNIGLGATSYITLRATGNIYIDKNFNVDPNIQKVFFKAGREIIVSPEVVMSSNMELTIAPSLIMPCELLNDVVPTNTEIAAFCNGSIYNSRSSRNVSIKTESNTESLISQNSDNLSWDFNLYPNPTTKETNLTFNGNFNESLEIHVFDVTGSEVLNSSVYNESRTSIDVSTLNKGLYFVGVISNGVTKTKQLIIQ